jgi:MFS family permease
MLRRPGAILALLTTLNLLNYLDRYILSAVLPLIQDELHISGFIAGTLATVFLVGYFATSPLFGQLADREGVRGGRKGLMAAGVALWSAATAATGFAGGTTGLLATRAFVGVGEASYATIAPTIIDDLAPPERKGRWLSIFYVAIPVGSALGFVVGGILGKHFGWRAAFFAVGGPGVLAALACLLIAEPARRSALKHVAIVKTARALIAIRLYRRAILGYAAQTFAIGGFGYWAPTYIYRHYGVPLDKASGTFGVILVLAGGAGTAFGGWWSDRWIARAGAAGDDASMARIALRVCSIPSFLAAPLAAAAVLAPTAQGFFALAFACELALFVSTSPVNAAILRAVPGEMRASAMALSIFAIHALGDLWSPPLIGWLQDVLPATVAMMAVPVALAVSAAVWWVRETSER